jgi:hypothetical protein
MLESSEVEEQSSEKENKIPGSTYLIQNMHKTTKRTKVSLASFILTYVSFWYIAFSNYLSALQIIRLDNFSISIDPDRISFFVTLGQSLTIIHIGIVEITLFGLAVLSFFLLRRGLISFLETGLFIFGTLFVYSIGELYYQPQFWNTFVTSVQYFYHLPLITNNQLFYISGLSLIPLSMISLTVRFRRSF